MDGMEATEKLFRGHIKDASGASQGLARGGAEVGGMCVNSSGGGSRGNHRNRGGRYRGVGLDGDQEGDDKMGEGDDPSEGSYWRAADCRKSHVAGGDTDTQGGSGILCYRPRGGGV